MASCRAAGGLQASTDGAGSGRAFLGCLSVVLFALWVWWRLRTSDGLIYRLAWDLEALAGAVRKREEEDQCRPSA